MIAEQEKGTGLPTMLDNSKNQRGRDSNIKILYNQVRECCYIGPHVMLIVETYPRLPVQMTVVSDSAAEQFTVGSLKYGLLEL